VRPEASAFLQRSRISRQNGGHVRRRLAGRGGGPAYLAALHAAQALIVDRTGRVIRHHRGVRNELWRLLKGDWRFDAELRGFLEVNCRLPDRPRRAGPARQSRRRAGMSRSSLDYWHNHTVY
jgi:hypothetical protein